VAAAKLSERYITDRFLPDKAIDVIDEAGARARLAAQVPPPEVAALKEQLEKINARRKRPCATRTSSGRVAARHGARAAGEIRRKQEEWEQRRQSHRPDAWARRRSPSSCRWTGIPVTRLQEAETSRLLRMEEELHESVVGQDEAIKALARSIRRSRAGLKDPRRPIGSFIFSGPTGVGKTELARSLARFLFADPTALIRVDMSEYMEKFSVSRLIGAPPGYVGYEDSGTLTKAIRRKPYSVVLLDEIEKAHPDVFNILLQVLDEGHLTDNYGRVIDFKNTVVIMTSNVGAKDITRGQVARVRRRPIQADFERISEKVKEEMGRVFNPEFLNRLDDVIVFHPLRKEHIAQIVHPVPPMCRSGCRRRRSRSSSPRRPRTSWWTMGTTSTSGPVRSSGRSSATSRIRSPRRCCCASSRRGTRSRWTWDRRRSKLEFRVMTPTTPS
jgi:ATP-dependent Clp protease ATP-binding subunit ClpC